MSALLRHYPLFMMSPPFGMKADAPNNVFMQKLSPKERQVDRGLALRQWLGPYHLLAANSIVAVLGQTEGLQDQSYVANVALVLSHLPEMPVIIANYTAPERTGESLVARRFFEGLGTGPVLTCPFRFEGEADCKRLSRNIYAIGVGMRTASQTALWFERQFAMRMIPIRMRNEYAYHLDCLLFALDQQRTMAAVEDLLPQEVKMLERVTQIIPVPHALVSPGATNLVRCGRMLLSASKLWEIDRNDENYEIEKAKVEFLTKVAADQRLEPCFFNVSEFEKSGAALSCMVLHLSRPEFDDG